MQQDEILKCNKADVPMQNNVLSFIGSNPITAHCPKSAFPHVHPSAYIGPFACVIGDVTIEENAFLAPHVTVRADEGTPFFIGAHTNLQDGVILHGLAEKRISHDGVEYSIYIGSHVSCGHSCVIHGPCFLGDRVFVGFGTLVMNAVVEDGCSIGHHAVVMGVKIAAGHRVPAGAVVDTQEKADALPLASKSDTTFSANVQEVNNAFPSAYTQQPGSVR